MSAKLYPYQEEGVQQIENFGGRALLSDEMGLGKSVTENTSVLTLNGWVPIGEIKVGDKVIGSDGKPYNVTGVYPQGKKQIYRVLFKDSVYIDCCKEHLWCVNTAIRHWRGNFPRKSGVRGRPSRSRNCLSTRRSEGWVWARSF